MNSDSHSPKIASWQATKQANQKAIQRLTRVIAQAQKHHSSRKRSLISFIFFAIAFVTTTTIITIFFFAFRALICAKKLG